MAERADRELFFYCFFSHLIFLIQICHVIQVQLLILNVINSVIPNNVISYDHVWKRFISQTWNIPHLQNYSGDSIAVWQFFTCQHTSVPLSYFSSPQGVSSLSGGAAIPSVGAQREAGQRGWRGTASNTHLWGRHGNTCWTCAETVVNGRDKVWSEGGWRVERKWRAAWFCFCCCCWSEQMTMRGGWRWKEQRSRCRKL